MRSQPAETRRIEAGLAAVAVILVGAAARADEFAAPLPGGVRAVWDIDKTFRESTETRERISINGLWRWQPARPGDDRVPAGSWGYFKVPGCWPGITDYMQKDCQTVFAHPSWSETRLGGIAAAWYEREIVVPERWAGRRIALSAGCVNSLAAVYVDGKPAGRIAFPAGELDLTPVCRPGGKHTLSILVEALPLKGVILSYHDTNMARQEKGRVARRGLCGDVSLVATPAGARIADVRVETSVRRRQVALDAEVRGLEAGRRYTLRARVADDDGREVVRFASPAFSADDLRDGRFAFAEGWLPDRLWDLHTPGNRYRLGLALVDEGGRALDTAFDARLGFREFWIDGRDFYLNGTRVFLSAVPLDNAQVGAAAASYEGARESLERLKAIGINFVYTHNYGCEPGAHLAFDEVLRAADDVGMLVALSQPHFSHYDWKAPDADRDNGYGRHAAEYVRQAEGHPSVVAYAMSHNATGYDEDMNPDLIDGVHDPRNPRARNNAGLALRAEAIVRRLDPGRVVYHHASGNLGALHSSNFYPNFVPIQELSDWFEHWATEGVKPVFTCEYGAPFTWDWAMYRGWYRGVRSFGSAQVPWEFCHAEWNAQFLGDRAYRIAEVERADLRWEARRLRAGEGWHRWDYPYELGSRLFEDRQEVIGLYLADNWRAFRTWGVSAISPWEYGHFWLPRAGVDRGRRPLPVDWDALQRPGFSADYLGARYERMDLAYGRDDWLPSPAAQALVRNNRPLLAYIAGKPARFTSKDHIVRPGEAVEKQVAVLNNSRETVTCACSWSFGPRRVAADAPPGVEGRASVTVATGQQQRIPLTLALPAVLAPGEYEIAMTARFSTGETQHDTFSIHVLPATASEARESGPAAGPRIALFDPRGETRAGLEAMGVRFEPVDAAADLSGFDLLVVGKSALTVEGPVPGLGRVRDGLRVLVFEQASDVLEKRLGFRVVEYGLRQVFPRSPGHPALAGLAPEHLQDWRGEATLVPPRLRYQLRPMHGPTVTWCDIPVSRAWRCGNRGNVASVLIEKPARGDFLPIVDGGYSLQYSPLLEYREGRGEVLFCQLDVTGRTESDPAAEMLVRNLIRYATAPRPIPGRRAVYAGDPAGRRFLGALGIAADPYTGSKLPPDAALVVGPGGGRELGPDGPALADWLKGGGRVLAIGLDEAEANAFLPFAVRMGRAEHIAAEFGPAPASSPLVGVGPADVHNRDPRTLPLVTRGAAAVGDGVLARAEGLDVVFCQLAPWTFGEGGPANVRRTYRRTSFLVARLLANMGVRGTTPILARFADPVTGASAAPRWRDGLYVDQPEEWDDPYRFFRW